MSFWRPVGNSLNAFSVESAIDDLALVGGVDPAGLPAVDYRQPRVAAGGWPGGHAQGRALWTAYTTTVAQVAEVSSPAAGAVRVNKVACGCSECRTCR
ncbi:MAG: hypothetical protein M3083_12780 [Actinomycetota bacterium]|nr:hypothetical protein [Actinomycetota bacterium]